MKYKEIFDKLGFSKLTEVQSKIENVNKNILILSSCGSGKTEASFFKMLEQGDKTILVEPMKILADGLHNRLNKYNKQLGLNKVSINYSNNEEDKFLQNKYSVTTIDQVLSGYLMLGKQSAIRGKNVLTSNLIFDEVQLFDTSTMLLTTINMLDELNKLGRKFIIMTATMPDYLISFLTERYNMETIITEDNRGDVKVNLFYNEELDYKKVLEYNDKQIIICNTIKQLREVYENLDKDRVIMLHSNYYNSDRKEIEKEVYKYFGKNSTSNNKILLATQVIEVGIDISCKRLYTTACRIDNLVQRVGRCCRWGGSGEVIVFKNNDKIYDKQVVENTIEYIINNNGIDFNWTEQKKAVSNILNDYYKNAINNKNLKLNKHKFKQCNRSNLIRDIENFNLIVVNDVDNITKADFKRESISLNINKLKQIKQTNDLYILDKSKIKKAKSIGVGDTVIIQGNGCVYNELGFYIGEDLFIDTGTCENSPKAEYKEIVFDDYVRETWLHHSVDVKTNIEKKLEEYKFNNYTYNNRNDIAFWLGLHDLGKLDKEWSRKYNDNEALAHFPFSTTRTEKRTHGLISAECLDKYIDNIIYNVIAQHHGKIYLEQEIVCSKYELRNDTYNILKEYDPDNRVKDIELKSSEKRINKNKIIAADNKDYTTFLFLVGLLMETEIESIKQYININKIHLTNKLK